MTFSIDCQLLWDNDYKSIYGSLSTFDAVVVIGAAVGVAVNIAVGVVDGVAVDVGVVIGVAVGVASFCVKQLSNVLLKAKNNFVTDPARFHNANDSEAGGDTTANFALISFFYLLGINIVLAVLAFLPVAYRPASGGSGIGEAKATLNGTYLL